MEKRGIYFCRHCGKDYPTRWQAELCFELDMEELLKDKDKDSKKLRYYDGHNIS